VKVPPTAEAKAISEPSGE